MCNTDVFYTAHVEHINFKKEEYSRDFTQNDFCM